MKRLRKLLLFLAAVQVVNTVSGIVLNNLYLNQRLGKGEINAFAVSGRAKEEVSSTDFRGGYLRAVMGGVELDLTKATIEDPPVTIKTTVVMGRAEIAVSEGWKVAVDTRTLFGGIHGARVPDVSDDEDPPDLVLTGKVVMGRVKILHKKTDEVAKAV